MDLAIAKYWEILSGQPPLTAACGLCLAVCFMALLIWGWSVLASGSRADDQAGRD